MDNQYYDLNKYKAGRSALLLVGIFTAVNCVLQYLDAEYSLLYAAALPQLGLALRGDLEVFGINANITFIVLTVIPILLYFICWYLSKKDVRWLLIGTVLFIVDAIALLFVWYLSGFSVSFLLNIVFEALILFQLITSVIAGRKLNGNIEEVEAQVEEMTGVVDENTQLYPYSKQLAKENKIGKTGAFVGVLLGYFGLTIGGMVPLLLSDETWAAILFILIMIGAIVFLIVGMIKLSPYVGAANSAYMVKDGCVYRISATNQAMQMKLENLQVFEETRDAYLCTYDDHKGKQRKITIPKAYPGIENILK